MTLSFLLGGIFFLAAQTLLNRLSSRPMRKEVGRTRTRTLLLRKVLLILSLGIRAARAALFVDSSWWNWGDAWTILRKSWDDTKRAAAEGVEALRLQERLKSTSVGPSGIIFLQYLMDHWTPNYLSRTMQTSLAETLRNIDDRNIQRIVLNDFDVGKLPPKVSDMRTFELHQLGMAFDIDVQWESEIRANMNVIISNRLSSVMGGRAMSLPFSVQNVRFEGTIRVILTPLSPEPPGFGAMLVSIPDAPNLGLDVRMAGGEITKFPWLRSEITSALQRCISDEFLWPRRMVIPSQKIITRLDGSSGTKTLLSKRNLEDLKYTDPLLQLERELEYSEDMLNSSKDHVIRLPEQNKERELGDLMQMDIRVNKGDEVNISNVTHRGLVRASGDSDIFVLGDWNIGNYTDFATNTMTTEFNNIWKNALTSVWNGSNTTSGVQQLKGQVVTDDDNDWTHELRP